MKLSARKLESYRRAEVVAQAVRKYIAAGNRVTQADVDMLAETVLDWMRVTGSVKYQSPKRRGRSST